VSTVVPHLLEHCYLPRTGAGIRDAATPPHAPEYSSLIGLGNYREHLDPTIQLRESTAYVSVGSTNHQ
jgi:hypothetical protein